MADKKKKNSPPDVQEYQAFQQQREVKRPVFKNCLKAFFVGGFICFIGQLISTFYMYFFHFTEQTAGNPTVATLIFLTMLLTGFGVYDRIGQFAGAGSAVPVTGFGNAVISSAIEHRTEGFILGVGMNMLKLAGPVIVYGVFAAFVVALIKTILIQWGGL
ncbi:MULTISPECIES: stage V sporulation protein AC [Clostridia]|uniref:stage V sporulation protein AC n=1 Tax=Clostridia TaxID=186801 RepID=UPI000EA30295|nr:MULTISPECIES: stage V sporulation protein AC [Clostridia]NBJ71399.1 stage V sporulation protein AC [Roseburia sp. 1XD42-34]RKI74660.1 stage V sporulation protein AC [Clostridium sp. 1xD42-85]